MNKIINIEILPPVFNVEDIMAGGKMTKRVVSYAINRYVREGKLFRIRRGVYSKVANPFYIAATLYNGYIGFSSALYLYGLKTEVEANVMVCVPKNYKKTGFLDKLIFPVNLSKQFYGFSLLARGDLDIPVSTYPKTIFDMFYKPKYANFYDLYVAVNNRQLSDTEWKRLLYYVQNSNLSTVRRVGYGLEGKAPQWFTDKLLKRSKRGSRTSFFFAHKPVNHNAKWDIFDDIDVKRWENAT